MKVVCAAHVDIATPVESAFGFVADIERWPSWMSSVVCAQQPDARPLGLNEEFVLCLQAGRSRRQETFEVTRLVPNAFLSLEGQYSVARRMDFRFEQRGAKTRISLSVGYPQFGGALARLFDQALRRRRTAADVRDSLLRLREMLEARVETRVFGEDLDDTVTVPLPPRTATQAVGAETADALAR